MARRLGFGAFAPLAGLLIDRHGLSAGLGITGALGLAGAFGFAILWLQRSEASERSLVGGALAEGRESALIEP
jgi:hypothetical protein